MKKRRASKKTERLAQLARDYRAASMVAHALETNGTIVWNDPYTLYFSKANAVKNSAGQWTSFSTCFDGREVDNVGAFIEAYVRKIENPAEFLRKVADALEGKLHRAYYDKAYRDAYWLAAKKLTKRTGPLPFPDRWRGKPTPAEVYKKLPIILTELGIKDMPTEHAMRRRLKILIPDGLTIRPKKR